MHKEEKQLVKEIKKYKIPQDWHKYEMGKLFNFSGGLSFSRNNLSDRGFPYLHYGDIHTSRKNCLNVKNEMNVLPKLKIPLNDVKEESLLKHGDVVFVDASEDYEGTSKCVVIENGENIPFISGLHTIVAKSKDEIIRNDYKKYCFENWDIKRQFAFFVTGISVFGLNKSNIARIIIPLSSLPEQQKIAEILSICDKVIELKEKLIEQKKLQKKYLMKALLDPKSPNFRRLPGFDKDWEEIKLGECFTERKENNCTLRLLSITSEKGVIDRMEIEHKDNSNEDKSKYKVILKGDIGYNTMRMWQGVSGVSNLTGIVSPAYTVCKPKEEICSEFFGYLFKLQSVINVFNRYSQGLVNDTLSLKYAPFAKLIFPIPKYEEQKTIANVLYVVDKEIDLLEKELKQQKLKKKALMQLLLTGKVRVNVS